MGRGVAMTMLDVRKQTTTFPKAQLGGVQIDEGVDLASVLVVRVLGSQCQTLVG